MSTILCRQPSMDSSHVIESTTMRLKLLPPKSFNHKTLFSDWSFLQSPSSHISINDSFNTDSYNQKSLKLSHESLQLCTESLGSESGSDTSEDDAIFASLSVTNTKRRRDNQVESKKVFSRSFPPPLTTMSGSNAFQVRPHREGGRLIIEAMEMNLGSSFIQAERSHGRLLLTCWKSEEESEFDVESSHENELKELGNGEEEMERNVNVVVENFQRLRRCNEDENGDKGICCNWEPCCWVATS